MGFENGSGLRNSDEPGFDERHLKQADAARRAASDKIEEFLRSHEKYVPIDELVRLRDTLVAQGAVAAEQANKLPGLKEAAEQAFSKMLRRDAVHHAGFNTERYTKVRDEWIAAGIVTLQEANSFSRVREIAEDDLFNAASAVNSLPDTIQALKTHWVDVGIVSQAEADKLIAEGRTERERYLHSPGGV